MVAVNVVATALLLHVFSARRIATYPSLSRSIDVPALVIGVTSAALDTQLWHVPSDAAHGLRCPRCTAVTCAI